MQERNEGKKILFTLEKTYTKIFISFNLLQNCVTEIGSNCIPHRYAELEAQYHLLFLDSPLAASLQ